MGKDGGLYILALSLPCKNTISGNTGSWYDKTSVTEIDNYRRIYTSLGPNEVTTATQNSRQHAQMKMHKNNYQINSSTLTHVRRTCSLICEIWFAWKLKCLVMSFCQVTDIPSYLNSHKRQATWLRVLRVSFYGDRMPCESTRHK